MYGSMVLGYMFEILDGRIDRRDMAEAEGHAEQSWLLAWEELLAAGDHDGSREARHGLRIRCPWIRKTGSGERGGQFRITSNQGKYRSCFCKDGAWDLREPWLHSARSLGAYQAVLEGIQDFSLAITLKSALFGPEPRRHSIDRRAHP